MGDERSLIAELITARMDAEVASYLALLFVLNFAWLPTAVMASDAALGAVRLARRRSSRTIAGADRRAIGFVTLAAGATLMALTRFITYSNVRYLMAGTALMLAVGYVALARLGLRPSVRRAALGAYGVLLVASAIRTVDPVSRWLWGTFPFGSHRMLDMTSITGECCGAGRDQLVYSLEFTRFHELTDSVLSTLMRDTATVIALPAEMDYHTVGRVDRTTWRRTLRRKGAFEPVVLGGPGVMADSVVATSLIYIAMPNARDSATLTGLSTRYAGGLERRFESGGYSLSAYELTRKARDSVAP
jgi:hypothetical protein